MSLDDLRALGIVVGTIVDAELGHKSIACVGTVTAGGIKSNDGQFWMGDGDLEAAMRCYEALDMTR
ncbi:hypothetical protein [Paraburkholderia dilworthii]|uniref:hypothetical protein n=1 Tax=Paraburkholderia dilworthii TaxID=948106 RepID=UPI000487552C|nr:hypothetical protein [Paraburkholderia dilworthii]